MYTCMASSDLGQRARERNAKPEWDKDTGRLDKRSRREKCFTLGHSRKMENEGHATLAEFQGDAASLPPSPSRREGETAWLSKKAEGVRE